MVSSIGIAICPHCNSTVDIRSRWGILKSKVGKPTYYTCKYCGGLYSDGKKEWPEMSTVEKIIEIIRFGMLDLLIMLSAGLLLMVGTAIIFNTESNTVWAFSFFTSAFIALAVSIFFNVRKVMLSKKRFAEEYEENN